LVLAGGAILLGWPASGRGPVVARFAVVFAFLAFIVAAGARFRGLIKSSEPPYSTGDYLGLVTRVAVALLTFGLCTNLLVRLARRVLP
jgi:hypothetical protein